MYSCLIDGRKFKVAKKKKKKKKNNILAKFCYYS